MRNSPSKKIFAQRFFFFKAQLIELYNAVHIFNGMVCKGNVLFFLNVDIQKLTIDITDISSQLLLHTAMENLSSTLFKTCYKTLLAVFFFYCLRKEYMQLCMVIKGRTLDAGKLMFELDML